MNLGQRAYEAPECVRAPRPFREAVGRLHHLGLSGGGVGPLKFLAESAPAPIAGLKVVLEKAKNDLWAGGWPTHHLSMEKVARCVQSDSGTATAMASLESHSGAEITS